MEKKAITLQQLEEALRDMSRWIKDKLKGFLQVPSTEGEPGYVLTTNGDGGYSWEVPHKGDGDSDFIWRPTVSAAGDLSWKKSKETVAPEPVNIKGQGYAANLLDNSDFTNPVNQRGETAYTANGYTVDRWANTYGTLTLNSGYVNWRSNSASSVYKRLMQKMGRKLEAGKTYTVAMLARVNAVSGYVELRLARNNAAVSGATQRIKDATSGFEWFVFSHRLTDDVDVPGFDLLVSNTESDTLDIDIKAAAIYEGEYTAETLPEYKPKGYAVELAECQRYLYRLSASAAAVTVTGGNAGGQYSYFYLPLPVAMQGTGVPTLEHSGVDVYPFQSGGAVEITAFTTGILSSRNGVTIRAAHATGLASARDAMALRIGAGGYLAINMEL